MKKLWHDEYGFEVNHVLKMLAKMLLVVSPLSLVAGFIWWGNWGFDEREFAVCLGSGAVVAVVCFFGAIHLLWLASLGNNVAKIRIQQETEAQ